MREIFINSDYDRTLIYIDMPFIPVADTAVAVEQINEYSEGFQGTHQERAEKLTGVAATCLLYTSPSPRDRTRSRMPSSA